MTLKEALVTNINSNTLNAENHSADNGFTSSDYNEFVKELLNKPEYIPMGISFKPPFSKYYTEQIAFVFYNKKEDKNEWCHFPVTAWANLIKQCYGDSKVDYYYDMLNS